MDVLTGDFPSRLGVYSRAARRQEAMLWIRLGIVWSVLLWAGLLAVSGVVLAAAMQQGLIKTPLGLAAAVATSLIALLLVRRAPVAPIHVMPYAVLLPCLVVFFRTHANRTIAGGLKASAAVLIVAIACIVLSSVACGTFAVIAGVFRREQRGSVYEWASSTMAMRVHGKGAGMAVGSVGMLVAIATLHWLDKNAAAWFSTHPWVSAAGNLGVGVIVVLYVPEYRRRFREIKKFRFPKWRAAILNGLIVLGCLAGIAAAARLSEFIIHWMLQHVAYLQLLLLGLVALYGFFWASLFCARLLRNRRLSRMSVEPVDFRRWLLLASASRQQELLTFVSRTQLGLSSEEYLDLLFEVEAVILREPAASVYWRLRSQVEQVIRQSQLDDEGLSESRL